VLPDGMVVVATIVDEQYGERSGQPAVHSPW